jgi:hypothetical protein
VDDSIEDVIALIDELTVVDEDDVPSAALEGCPRAWPTSVAEGLQP